MLIPFCKLLPTTNPPPIMRTPFDLVLIAWPSLLTVGQNWDAFFSSRVFVYIFLFKLEIKYNNDMKTWTKKFEDVKISKNGALWWQLLMSYFFKCQTPAKYIIVQ